jgi:folate-binding protein YgfZ
VTETKVALLPDRGIVRVAGEDAEKLLQGIVTNDMDLLASRPAIHTALLAPQGKILFDFFVATTAGGFLIDTDRAQAEGLVKRLTMYKLRAKVAIEDLSAGYQVLTAWGDAQEAGSFPDPRLEQLGWRGIVSTNEKAVANATAEAYHARRIALGMPEGGKDYAFGDAFPHEANLDVLGSVSFTKGCFVGQEVVSRMQHRGTARKRIVIVEGDGDLQPGAEVTAGEAAIGSIGSVAGRQALALLRLDRAREAIDKGEPLRAGGISLAMRLPDYLKSANVAAAS